MLMSAIRDDLRSCADPDATDLQGVIAAARQGDMFVILAHGGNGTDGTLVAPADSADADVVNRMARHARGLVCLPLDEVIIDRLALNLMPQTNRSRLGTAFTVSIEAREGITTGISAEDRARTIAAAVNAEARPDDIVSPGHVFPIRVERQEYRLRPSACAAAVEICRAAGLTPAAVTCVLMSTDGSIAGEAEAVRFAEDADLKVVRAEDLIAGLDAVAGRERAVNHR